MAKLLYIKPRAYFDSVTLMAISQQISSMEGVEQAVVAMGTDHNKELLEGVGLLTSEAAAANPDDMIIAISATTDATAKAAADAAEAALKTRGSAGGGDAAAPAPRSISGAIKQMPGANLAVISVPGAYAKREAMQALMNGLHVMLFSDNVPLADELALKKFARSKGLLCMGPDCGTAILDGVALCFANVVRRGSVGVVAASGTGAQEVSVLIHRFGGGVSHVIGTGGRDLQPEIGGLMMLSGIEMLAQDEATETILLVSKPPHPDVAAKVLAALRQTGKRAIACFLGYEGEAPAGVALATNLRDAAALAAGAAAPVDGAAIRAQATDLAARVPAGASRLRGLYSGGTLCDEARLEIARLGLTDQAELIDYGDDEYTVGRPHPMIDPTLRMERLREAGAHPETAVILLDVVLGYGSNVDAAGLLAPVIAQISQPVVVSVCGTEADPQVRSRQVAVLEAAGAVVAASNLEAARLAGQILLVREGAQ